MNELSPSKVQIDLLSEEKGDKETTWTIRISNSSDKIAFFIRSQIMSSGEELLPTYWSGNYVTLAPTEGITLTVTCPSEVPEAPDTYFRISGWNIEEKTIALH